MTNITATSRRALVRLMAAFVAIGTAGAALATLPTTAHEPELISSGWQVEDVDQLTGHERGVQLWGNVRFEKKDRSWERDPNRAFVTLGVKNTARGQCIAARIWVRTTKFEWSPVSVGWSQKEGFNAGTSVDRTSHVHRGEWAYKCPTRDRPFRKLYMSSTVNADPKFGQGQIETVAVQVYTWKPGTNFSHNFFDVNDKGGR